jgi:hypothetical protein
LEISFGNFTRIGVSRINGLQRVPMGMNRDSQGAPAERV